MTNKHSCFATKKVLLAAAATIILIFTGCGTMQDNTATSELQTPVPTADAVLPDHPAGEAFDVPYSDKKGYRLDFLTDEHAKDKLDSPQIVSLSDRYLAVTFGYAESDQQGDSRYLRSFSVYDVLTGERLFYKDDLFCGGVKATRGNAFCYDSETSTLFLVKADDPGNCRAYDMGRYIPSISDQSEGEYSYIDIACLENTFFYTRELTLYAVNLDTMERRTVLTAGDGSEYTGDIYSSVYTGSCSDFFCVDFTKYIDDNSVNYSFAVSADGSYHRIDIPVFFSVFPTADERYFSFNHSTRTVIENEGLAVRSLQISDNAYIYAVFGSQIIAVQQSYGDESKTSLIGYDFDRGVMTMCYDLGDQEDAGSAEFIMGGSYLLYTDYTGNIRAVPYDPAATIDDGSKSFDTDLSTEPATRSGNCIRAKRISRQYGVIVNIYEDAIIYFFDYAAITMTDDKLIHDSLVTLEKCLSQFPENFFAELTSYGELNELDIMLVGRLIRGDSTSTSNPIGYASSDYENHRKILTIDISSGDFASTVFHEIMHYIDDQSMIAWSEKGIGDGMSDWYSYNPYGFNYNYGYLDAEGNDFYDPQYTISDDTNEVYFVDSYCKTYATEDKARTFEAIMSVSGMYSSAKDYPHLKAKMQYLVRSIKGTFTTMKDLDKFEWYNNLFGEE